MPDLTITVNLYWLLIPMALLGLALFVSFAVSFAREFDWTVGAAWSLGLLAVSQVGGGIGYGLAHGFDLVALAQIVGGSSVVASAELWLRHKGFRNAYGPAPPDHPGGGEAG